MGDYSRVFVVQLWPHSPNNKSCPLFTYTTLSQLYKATSVTRNMQQKARESMIRGQEYYGTKSYYIQCTKGWRWTVPIPVLEFVKKIDLTR